MDEIMNALLNGGLGIKTPLITGEYKNFWRFEVWDWFLPHPDYDPACNGRVHIIGKLYFRIG